MAAMSLYAIPPALNNAVSLALVNPQNQREYSLRLESNLMCWILFPFCHEGKHCSHISPTQLLDDKVNT